MFITTWWEIAAAGMSGPLIVELAKLATWRNVDRIAARWHNPLYWVSFFSFVVLGGVLATFALYSDGASVPIYRAVHIGATSPLIVAAWASAETGEFDRRFPSRRSGRIVQGRDATDERRQSVWETFKQALRW